jgi:hypothetical protein
MISAHVEDQSRLITSAGQVTDVIYAPLTIPECVIDLFPLAEGARALVHCANGEEIYAGHVVVATPIGCDTCLMWGRMRQKMCELTLFFVVSPLYSISVLQKESITFSPPLPEDKMRCIRKIGTGTLNYVYMHFKR